MGISWRENLLWQFFVLFCFRRMITKNDRSCHYLWVIITPQQAVQYADHSHACPRCLPQACGDKQITPGPCLHVSHQTSLFFVFGSLLSPVTAASSVWALITPLCWFPGFLTNSHSSCPLFVSISHRIILVLKNCSAKDTEIVFVNLEKIFLS